MPEEVDLDLLRNCTLLAVNKFPWATTVNDTAVIGAMNLTHVIDLISEMIDVFREQFLEDDSIKYVYLCSSTSAAAAGGIVVTVDLLSGGGGEIKWDFVMITNDYSRPLGEKVEIRIESKC